MKTYSKLYKLERERSGARQLVIGSEEKDRILDWRIMAQPKSKCSETKGMRELEEWGRIMATTIGAMKQAKQRTVRAHIVE